jgi:hypothetical protein
MRNEKVKNAKDPTKRSEHEIIKGFNLKEQQKNFVTRSGSWEGGGKNSMARCCPLKEIERSVNMLMKIPARIKIVMIIVSFAVAAPANLDREEFEYIPPPPEQPWKSGATMVMRSQDGVFRVSGKGAMEDYDWIYGSLVFSGESKGKNRLGRLIKRFSPWSSGLATAVVIEDGVTHIGNEAFASRNSLTSVTIPSSVSSIGERAFMHCKNLTSATIPNGVTHIGAEAFIGSGLTSVAIPSSVVCIGYAAFQDCRNLTSVTISGNGTSVGEKAFLGCADLTSVTLNDGVTVIGEGAFWLCTSLTSITIPSSVVSIEVGAFSECTNLKSISILSPVPPKLGRYAFDGVSYGAKLHIPRKSRKAYMAADGWKELLSELSPERDGLWISATIIMAVIILAAAGFVIIKRSRKTSVKSGVSGN